MTRREFLRRSALAALGLSACSLNIPEAELERTGARKRVIVIGGGLAGLAAGYELTQAGHDATILEARARPGGRVQTLREPFSDGLYAEAGALFIPDIHDLTMRYVKLFDLPLVPIAPRAAGKFYYLRGRRIQVTRGAKVTWPFDLTPEEESLGFSGMWQKYIGAVLPELGEIRAPGWPPASLLEQYDRPNGAEFLRARGASPGAVSLLRLGYFDLSGDGLESNSALFMLRDLTLRRNEKQNHAIRGGNDLLPKAFASRLPGKIRYEAPVVRIEPGERAASVVIRHATGYERLTADHIVCAIPFSVLRQIEISPPFSPQKQTAIEQLPYTSVVRIYLQSRRKFWDEQGLPNSATTDLPIKWIQEPTVNQPGPRGILESYTAGDWARRLTAMKEADRIRFVLDEVERVFPGMREQFEVGASKSWDEDPWARGGYVWFKPGQMSTLLPHIARPEGRVHFAGEHASTWPQWMQGALESGLRAAREIHEAP